MTVGIFQRGLRLPLILQAVREALFPAKCLSCGRFLKRGAEGGDSGQVEVALHAQSERQAKEAVFKWAMAAWLCPDCCATFRPAASPLCPRCGVMFAARSGDDHTCGECLLQPKRFRMARAFGVYDAALMDAVHRFKYRGKIQLARPLGILLATALRIYWRDDPPELVLPVPLHPRRLRQRGFNQALLLMRDWFCGDRAPSLQLPPMAIERDILQRRRWTPPQTGLGRKTRLKNIRNAFAVERRERIVGKKILLVDDVYTTGATVNECARTLRKAGAAQVDVLTLARTL